MRRWLRWTQYALWTLGFVALAYTGLLVVDAVWSQREGSRELQRSSASVAHPIGPVAGAVFGLMEVPRIGLSVIVFEGSDEGVLGRGAGHLMDTASLKGAGNVVLAGHRDTFFRPLRNIRVGDTIRVKTASVERTYTVESTKIVTPKDVGVLDPTPDAVLTLVTCYPFRYVGPAPDRFIVRAKETTPPSEQSVAPQAVPSRTRALPNKPRALKVVAKTISIDKVEPETAPAVEPAVALQTPSNPPTVVSAPARVAGASKILAPVNAVKRLFHRVSRTGI